MNNRLLRLQLLSMVALSMVLTTITNNSVVNQYNLRPQSLNSARKVSGEVPGYGLVHLNKDEIYGYFGITPAYDQTFRPRALAESLFGACLLSTATTPNTCRTSCHKTSLLIQGTAVTNRAANALRAEDFYLGEIYNSVLSFSPKICNFLLDFQFYLGFGDVYGWNGGYLRVYVPFVHTTWNLHMSESITTPGKSVIAGSFYPDTLTELQLLRSARDYFSGRSPANITFNANATAADPTGTPQTLVRNGLCAAKIATHCTSNISTNTGCRSRRIHSKQNKNGFGDMRAELGWNFFPCDDGHVGLNIQVAAPTGNRSTGEYLFEPIVGNGKHWELGGGLTAHYVWWRSCDEDKQLGLYLDATVTHLFNTTQTRVFDLKNKPLSRYMLAGLHTRNVVGSLSGEIDTVSTAATSQFANVFTPVANLTKQKVQVSVDVQSDLSLWFNYSSCGFSLDLGYNFFGQTCEKISDAKHCPPRLASEGLWALKGDAHAYGFTANNTPNPNDNTIAYALSFSESGATIISPATNNNQNANVNGPQEAFATGPSTDSVALFSNPNTAIPAPALHINTSIQPVFLTINDIDFQQRSRIITNKVFIHFQHKWEKQCWSPFIGLGGEVEFGTSANGCNTACGTSAVNCSGNSCTTTTATNCKTNCANCTRIGTTQWGIWLKTGVAFN